MDFIALSDTAGRATTVACAAALHSAREATLGRPAQATGLSRPTVKDRPKELGPLVEITSGADHRTPPTPGGGRPPSGFRTFGHVLAWRQIAAGVVLDGRIHRDASCIEDLNAFADRTARRIAYLAPAIDPEPIVPGGPLAHHTRAFETLLQAPTFPARIDVDPLRLKAKAPEPAGRPWVSTPEPSPPK